MTTRSARYQRSPKGKAANKRYRQSSKGKATKARYAQTAKAKARQAEYVRSPEGKAAQAKARAGTRRSKLRSGGIDAGPAAHHVERRPAEP
jgi:hypothetical protein